MTESISENISAVGHSSQFFEDPSSRKILDFTFYDVKKLPDHGDSYPLFAARLVYLNLVQRMFSLTDANEQYLNRVFVEVCEEASYIRPVGFDACIFQQVFPFVVRAFMDEIVFKHQAVVDEHRRGKNLDGLMRCISYLSAQ